MSKEDSKNISRREATGKLVQVIALATGLSAMEVQGLLAQTTYKPRTPVRPKPLKPTQKPTAVSPTLARNLIVSQKSGDERLAALKVMLENSEAAFEAEYGRTTPIQNIPADQIWDHSQLPPDMASEIIHVCGANFDPGFGEGMVVGVGVCNGTNTCTGQELTGSGPDGSPCMGTNVCDGQNCSKQQMCEDNTCSGQTCPNFKICQPKNKESLVSADMLDQLSSNLYVQLLFKEFDVQTAAELANSINSTLTDIAAGEMTGWPPR